MLSLKSKSPAKLVINNILFKKLWQKSTLICSENFFDKIVPKDVRPSENFIEFVQNEKLTKNFTVLIGQINLLYHKTKNVPTVLTDDDWTILLKMKTINDKEFYINQLYLEETKEIAEKGDKKISEINQEKYLNNEMVYARNFHELLSCYGSDFRDRININYGSNYCGFIRNNQKILKIIFDCRYLFRMPLSYQNSFTSSIKKMWNYHWFQGIPIDITLTNFVTDPVLSNAAKRNFTFLYGIPNKKVGKIEEDSEGFFLPSEGSYPLIPTVTVKKTSNFYDKEKEKIAFISSKAYQYLPDDISMFDGFVILATDETLQKYSKHVASQEKIPAFKIPIEKNVIWTKGSKLLNPLIYGKLLTSVHYKEMNWKKALESYIPTFHFTPINTTERDLMLKQRSEKQYLLKMLSHYTDNLEKEDCLSKDNVSEKKVNNRKLGEVVSDNSFPEKKKRKFLYTTEERDQLRQLGILKKK